MTDNIWDRLSQDTAKNIGLLASAGRAPNALLGATRSFLQGSHQSGEWITIDQTYQALGGPESPGLSVVRGAAGFMALTARVMRPDLFASGVRPTDTTALDIMERYFRDRSVRWCIAKLYGLPKSLRDSSSSGGCECKVGLADASFYRPGTTSFILKCRISTLSGGTNKCRDHPREVALKLILVPYTGRAFTAITVATRSTAATFQALRYARGSKSATPDVYQSGDDYVVMDFIEGPTLEQLLLDPVPVLKPWLDEQAPVDKRYSLLQSVGVSLIEALDTLRLEAAAGDMRGAHIPHLDLSPANIIVTGVTRNRIDLVLIDIGTNFLLTSEVGLAPAVIAAERYTAPELRGWQNDASQAGSVAPPDVYSLGMILLDLADRSSDEGGANPVPGSPKPARPWRRRGDASQSSAMPLALRRSTSEAISGMYRHSPEIGRLLEDLVEEDPSLRLHRTPPDMRSDPYSALAEQLQDQIKLARIAAKTMPQGAGDPSSIRSMVSLFRFKEPKTLLLSAVAQLPGTSPAGSDPTRGEELSMWQAIRRLRTARR
nr:hypothetical protein [Actinomycetota bacterium]